MTVKKTKTEKNQISACWLTTGILFAVAAGCMAGWARYWYGYFVLGQGVLAGLFYSVGGKDVLFRVYAAEKNGKNAWINDASPDFLYLFHDRPGNRVWHGPAMV